MMKAAAARNLLTGVFLSGTSSWTDNLTKFCRIPPTLMFVIAYAAGLVTIGEGHAKAGEYKRIPVQIGQPASPELATLIDKLQRAVKSGDATFIMKSVSDDFRCVRDFGGICSNHMTGREKFATALGLNLTTGKADLRSLDKLLDAKLFAKSNALGELEVPLTCAPALPLFDRERLKQIDTELFQGDGETYWFNWVAVEGQGIAAVAKPNRSSARIGNLSRELIHVRRNSDGEWLNVDLPSGSRAYVRSADVTYLLPAQLCYACHPSKGWQISAFVGGGD